MTLVRQQRGDFQNVSFMADCIKSVRVRVRVRVRVMVRVRVRARARVRVKA